MQEDLNQEFENYEDAMIGSIDTVLTSLEYKILNKFLLDQVIYVKCVNPNGHKVYVKNDLQLYTNSKNIIPMNNIESNNISYSFKFGCYDTLDNTCCGVLFELPDGYITVVTRVDMKPKEYNYSLTGFPPKSKTLSEDFSIVTYPVVNFSDIIENPNIILGYMDKNIINFKNDQLILQSDNINLMFDDISEIAEKFEKFNQIKQDVVRKIDFVMINLIKWNNICRDSELTTDEDKNKATIVRKNLEIRNDEITSILRLISKVSSKREDLKNISKELNSSISMIEEFLESASHQLIC